jgi:hypothetical protein
MILESQSGMRRASNGEDAAEIFSKWMENGREKESLHGGNGKGVLFNKAAKCIELS